MPGILTVAIVTFSPDLQVLSRTINSLAHAAGFAKQAGTLDRVNLCLVDNGPGSNWSAQLRKLQPDFGLDDWQVFPAGSNLGYGCGHNLAIQQLRGDWHLILNPDVTLQLEALKNAVDYLVEHPDVGLLTPFAVGANGKQQFLCKRFPAVFDLLLRGFAPSFVRAWFADRLAYYEMQDVTQESVSYDIRIISGCFMFFRRTLLDELNGFNSVFFLYFEDFDLSLRAATRSLIGYVPSVRIVHEGGRAADKGWWHVWMFLQSVIRLYRLHGWKLI